MRAWMQVGKDPFARTPSLSHDFVDLLNLGITYHFTSANYSDSAAAFFGMCVTSPQAPGPGDT